MTDISSGNDFCLRDVTFIWNRFLPFHFLLCPISSLLYPSPLTLAAIVHPPAPPYIPLTPTLDPPSISASPGWFTPVRVNPQKHAMLAVLGVSRQSRLVLQQLSWHSTINHWILILITHLARVCIVSYLRSMFWTWSMSDSCLIRDRGPRLISLLRSLLGPSGFLGNSANGSTIGYNYVHTHTFCSLPSTDLYSQT